MALNFAPPVSSSSPWAPRSPAPTSSAAASERPKRAARCRRRWPAGRIRRGRAGHPPAAAAQREGKVAPTRRRSSPTSASATRTSSGIFADGDTVWVGTSGGVVRYDTRSDEYKLFDTKSGLLSNGVFHVGKLGDASRVGTYGGGLSLLDPKTETVGNLQHPRRPGRCLRLRRAEGEERRRLDRHLVGREPHRAAT